ncbi:MAG: 50S ribosomal protein L7/L12 [Candidatus Woykebacteria bacterium RIFCSPLOWO2_01_FULL_43_14]|uniref:Large ribosomal subunit protein bL12 n=1 Tax=Candidatus Woykebacteria bacterium RIFCSPLOWO2_01_FULL_43_14 TaxID=1802605 RepID=A0A1G1WYC4_9BACT|nr:MAG: 50S ribosomal protein L7/L12 [Candidatus Woykebacteria bacterium RIFCSPLOWO2_01_FULL_43_14]
MSKDQIMEAIESMSVLDLSELIKALEEKFGVSAAAPAAVAVSPAVGASPAEGGEAVEEKSSFNVILSNAGANKIAVIKAIREIVPTLGLKEAKDLADSAPKPIAEGLNKEAANEAKTKLEAAGGTVELK